jgi:hypothetical protein
MVAHNSLTDPELHEPKGVSSATSGTVYVANGSGSGSWKELYKSCSVAFTPSTSSPYTHNATTSDAILNPTVSVVTNMGGFTRLTSPNLRIRYDGTSDFMATVTVDVSSRDASTASRQVQLVLFKNGTVLPNSRIYNTMPDNGAWYSTSMTFQVQLATNDYIELAHASSASGNIDYAKININVSGVTL